MAAAGPNTRRRAPDRATPILGCRDDNDLASGHVSQQEHPDCTEQHGAGKHDEAGVTEREFEANAKSGCSIHDRFRPGWHLRRLRCGIRRRPRSR